MPKKGKERPAPYMSTRGRKGSNNRETMKTQLEVKNDRNNSPVKRSELDELKEMILNMSEKINQLTKPTNKSSMEQNEPSTSTSKVKENITTDLTGGGGNISMNIETNRVTQQIDDIINNHMTTVIEQPQDSGETHISDQTKRPIDYKVPMKDKQQIWNNEYIDLTTLLIDKFQNNKTNKSFHLVCDDSDNIKIQQNKTTKTISNLGQWCDAFLVYLAIYCQKHPTEVQQLTTYMQKIKLLSFRGADYLWYDQEFRYGRSVYGGDWSIDSDLWLLANNTQSQMNNRNYQTQGKTPFRSFNKGRSPLPNRPQHKAGYCFKYHSKGECGKTNCPYSHQCYAEGCNASHPIFRCKRRTNGTDNKTYNTTTADKTNTNKQAPNTGKSV